MTNVPLPEFSRPVDITDLGDAPRHESLVASAEECASLAARLDLQKLENFTAELALTKEANLIKLGGKLEADVTQTSVVDLEPVDSRIVESFEAFFTLEPQEIDPDVEILLETDMPEVVEGDTIDIGEVTVQHLALALDPYPRKEGEGLEGERFDSDPKTSPFSVLETLKTEK